MIWFLILCYLLAHFQTFYAMEEEQINLEKLQALPHDLQKVVLLQSKETKNCIYDSTKNRLITLQFNIKPKDELIINNPWKFGLTQNNPQLTSIKNKKLNVIYFKNFSKKETPIPIYSTSEPYIRHAGPNKNGLAIINDKAFFLDTITKEPQQSIKNFIENEGIQKHTTLSCKYPTHIHPEKNWFIGAMSHYIKVLFLNDEKKEWEEQKLPSLKKPVTFGPKHLIVCKQFWEKTIRQYITGEVNVYDLYDIKTKNIYDTLNFPDLITHKNTIPLNILENNVKLCHYAQRNKKTFAEEFLKNPKYDIANTQVNYFPELENFLLFSFSLYFLNGNKIHKTDKPLYFVLYDVKKKSLHYMGSSLTHLTYPFFSNSKKSIYSQTAQILNKNFDSSEIKTPQLENHILEIKIKPENMLPQLISLALIANTWNWLQQENPSLKEGQEILNIFKNKNYIKNNRKLIWQSTTKKHGNIFKQLYEKVKKLEQS